MNEKMSPALARVIIKRVHSALERAKYYPSTATDLDAMARKVVAPFVGTVVDAKGDASGTQASTHQLRSEGRTPE